MPFKPRYTKTDNKYRAQKISQSLYQTTSRDRSASITAPSIYVTPLNSIASINDAETVIRRPSQLSLYYDYSENFGDQWESELHKPFTNSNTSDSTYPRSTDRFDLRFSPNMQHQEFDPHHQTANGSFMCNASGFQGSDISRISYVERNFRNSSGSEFEIDDYRYYNEPSSESVESSIFESYFQDKSRDDLSLITSLYASSLLRASDASLPLENNTTASPGDHIYFSAKGIGKFHLESVDEDQGSVSERSHSFISTSSASYDWEHRIFPDTTQDAKDYLQESQRKFGSQSDKGFSGACRSRSYRSLSSRMSERLSSYRVARRNSRVAAYSSGRRVTLSTLSEERSQDFAASRHGSSLAKMRSSEECSRRVPMEEAIELALREPSPDNLFPNSDQLFTMPQFSGLREAYTGDWRMSDSTSEWRSTASLDNSPELHQTDFRSTMVRDGEHHHHRQVNSPENQSDDEAQRRDWAASSWTWTLSDTYPWMRTQDNFEAVSPTFVTSSTFSHSYSQNSIMNASQVIASRTSIASMESQIFSQKNDRHGTPSSESMPQESCQPSPRQTAISQQLLNHGLRPRLEESIKSFITANELSAHDKQFLDYLHAADQHDEQLPISAFSDYSSRLGSKAEAYNNRKFRLPLLDRIQRLRRFEPKRHNGMEIKLIDIRGRQSSNKASSSNLNPVRSSPVAMSNMRYRFWKACEKLKSGLKSALGLIRAFVQKLQNIQAPGNGSGQGTMARPFNISGYRG